MAHRAWDMPRDEQWQKVIDNLAPPAVRNGIYPALEIPARGQPLHHDDVSLWRVAG